MGPDGEVYVAGRTQSRSGALGVGRSDNAQDPLVPVPTFELSEIALQRGRFTFRFGGSPVNPSGLFMQSQVVVDSSGGPFHGRVYVLSPAEEAFDGNQIIDLVLLRSDDRGETWHEPVQVVPSVDTDAYRWFGTFAIAPNGRLDIVYNDTVNSPDDPSFSETYYTTSTDGGDTWTAPVQLGPQWSSHLGWPNQNKIGDYYDMVSDDVGAHLIYATTYNDEQDVYYLRIGDYDCNANGVGDSIDIDDGTAADCNANGIPDSCEIATGAEPDEDNNGVPDRCECDADLGPRSRHRQRRFLLLPRSLRRRRSPGQIWMAMATSTPMTSRRSLRSSQRAARRPTTAEISSFASRSTHIRCTRHRAVRHPRTHIADMRTRVGERSSGSVTRLKNASGIPMAKAPRPR